MFPETAGAWINVSNRFSGTGAWKGKCLNGFKGVVVGFQSAALAEDLKVPVQTKGE
jgi:hypothetical protein